MTIRFGLDEHTIQSLRSVILKRSGVDKIILYGSRAKGNFKPGSDIDITLVAPALTLTDLLSIENDIDDLMLPYKVDLSLLHSIENPGLVEHIERVGIEI